MRRAVQLSDCSVARAWGLRAGKDKEMRRSDQNQEFDESVSVDELVSMYCKGLFGRDGFNRRATKACTCVVQLR